MNAPIAAIHWIAGHVRFMVTERDGISTCVVRVLGVVASLLVFVVFTIAAEKFLKLAQPDFNGLATLIGALGAFMTGIGAVIAYKNRTESDERRP
jgi:hypothetical protein